MVPNIVDIDRLVREVLLEMGLVPQASKEPDESTVAESAPKEEPQHDLPAAGDVVVTDRVVTLAGVSERLRGARRLVVPARAVVTPAVRDELRRKKVSLVFEEQPSTATGDTGQVAMAVLGSRIDPTAVVDELRRLEIRVDLERFDCLIRATDELACRVTQREQQTVGVVLSNHGAAALCLANRHAGVRAVLASDESRTATDTAALGANILIVEPKRTPPYAMRQIVSAFCQQGPGTCPEALRQRLA